MAIFDIEGKLRQKLGVQSGVSKNGDWSKQDFIIEFQDGNYPSELCVTAWGQDKVADLGNYQVGDTVKVSFSIRSREYNGRWYTEVRLWKFGTPGQATPAGPRATAATRPAAPVPPATTGIPAPSLDDMPGESTEDDFPF